MREERARRLKDVNGYHIWKIWNPQFLEWDICYDVCGEDDEIFDSFRTLEEAKEFCLRCSY